MENTQIKYRLGRKQQRAILTTDGKEVTIIHKNYQHLAQPIVNFLNNETPTDLLTTEIMVLKERIAELGDKLLESKKIIGQTT